MATLDALTLTLPSTELGRMPVTELLTRYLCVRYSAVLSEETCQRYVRAIYDARQFWHSDFDGAQFSLGRAWYTHLEQQRVRLYFGRSQESDRLVERILPSMQSQMRELMSTALGEQVKARVGWCGPGVHIFPAAGWCARHGGDIHFDSEGLQYPEPLRHTAALTMIVMLQPPECGGGLKVWNTRYQHSDSITPDMLATAHTVVPYQMGDLVIIDAYQLHQIQPFEGQRDRISITAHLARVSHGWVCWF